MYQLSEFNVVNESVNSDNKSNYEPLILNAITIHTNIAKKMYWYKLKTENIRVLFPPTAMRGLYQAPSLRRFRIKSSPCNFFICSSAILVIFVSTNTYRNNVEHQYTF